MTHSDEILRQLAARICRAAGECRELADLLTMAGVEIEGIEQRGANFENVVVAQIKARRSIRTPTG